MSQGAAEGCRAGRALDSASWIAASADGRNVYVGGQDSNSVDVFARERRTGALAQLPGRSGCIAQADAEGCATGRGLEGTRPVVVAPGGRNVYAGSLLGVAAFARNPATGQLSQLSGDAGCVQEVAREGCAVGRGVAYSRALTVSRDGRFVYVAAHDSSAVAVFARLPGSGRLRQLAGSRGCVSEQARPGCALGRGLQGERGVTLSPDQRFLYAAAEDGNSVGVFARDARTGALRQLPGRAGCLQQGGTDGCHMVRAMASPHELVLSGDGRYVYVASSSSDSVTILRRNPVTGVLAQLPGRRGCIQTAGAGGCASGPALRGAHSLVLSPGGRLLYVAANADDAISVLGRDATSGTLTPLAGPRGCIATPGGNGCTSARGLRGVHSIVLSPGARNLYAASELSDAVVTLTP